MTRDVLEASDAIVRLLGTRLDDPARGATALAIALGRVCNAAGMSVGAVVPIAEMACVSSTEQAEEQCE